MKKQFFNIDSGEVEEMRFLPLDNINKYNKEMENVDLVDQLCSTYRLDKLTRNRKWWSGVLV